MEESEILPNITPHAQWVAGALFPVDRDFLVIDMAASILSLKS